MLTTTLATLATFAGCTQDDGVARSGETEAPLPRGAPGDTPGATWTAAEPTADRWDAALLDRAVALADSVGSGALLVIDDGTIVGSTGDIDEPYQVASIRKSLLSVLIGMAVDAGRIDLDATLAELSIDDLPPALTPVEKTATVRHLLGSRSGIYHEAAYEPASMDAQRPERGSRAPGEFWFYNNWDFNALGTIYERATGRDAFEAFDVELAGPLGMEDWTLDGQTWVGHPATEHPAYVFRISPRDLARVGLLLLRDGRWGDRRLVSAAWVEESTSPAGPEARPGTGYGYMWWTPVEGRHYRDVRVPEGSFIARGTGPHAMLVVPALDLVMVHAAETNRPRPSRWVDPDDLALMFGTVLEARGFDALP